MSLPTGRFWQIQLENSTERLLYCIENWCCVNFILIVMIVGLDLVCRARLNSFDDLGEWRQQAVTLRIVITRASTLCCLTPKVA